MALKRKLSLCLAAGVAVLCKPASTVSMLVQLGGLVQLEQVGCLCEVCERSSVVGLGFFLGDHFLFRETSDGKQRRFWH